MRAPPDTLAHDDGAYSAEPDALHHLPSPPPFLLTFTDLTYAVRTRSSPAGAKTKLLDSVSGWAKVGEVLAVLGASGSGKSTLLDALAGRISRASLRGSVELNGVPLLDRGHRRLLRSVSAYVMQDDLLFPMLTVEETLLFSAEFRLSLPAAKKRERVDSLIDQLGLRAAAKTIIGDEGHRGVSGGERRRVSIGVDIIHNPILLFLDEPTSGLDSTSAFIVVKVIKEIALSGSVVVMSIHQPSARILGLLDRLLFLSHGRTVFAGSPDELQPFFTEFGKPVPEDENRAEFALDLIRELDGSPEGAGDLLVEFNRTWQLRHQSSTATNPIQNIVSLEEAIRSRAAGASSTKGDGPHHGFANPLWVEFLVLTRRSLTNMSRSPSMLATRFAAVTFTGFVLATIFWRLDASPAGARERLGFFALALSTVFYTCAEAIPAFLEERYIFARETAHNAYRRSSYVLSTSVAALPSLVVLSIALAATTFSAVGLSGGAPGFFFFFLVILASFWCGSSLMTFFSGVISDAVVGYTVVLTVLACFVLFSGFFIARGRIPPWWVWFHYLSLVKYPYEAALRSEFGGPAGRCFVSGAQVFDESPLGKLPVEVKVRVLDAMSSALGVNISAGTCLAAGPYVLRQQGIVGLSKWSCVWATLAWGFFFRVLFYFALLIGNKNKRS